MYDTCLTVRMALLKLVPRHPLLTRKRGMAMAQPGDKANITVRDDRLKGLYVLSHAPTLAFML